MNSILNADTITNFFGEKKNINQQRKEGSKPIQVEMNVTWQDNSKDGSEQGRGNSHLFKNRKAFQWIFILLYNIYTHTYTYTHTEREREKLALSLYLSI